jgi:hypothetical protein
MLREGDGHNLQVKFVAMDFCGNVLPNIERDPA